MISKPGIMTGGEDKCRRFKVLLKLRDQQTKAFMYIYRLLYQSITVTENQKSIIDIKT